MRSHCVDATAVAEIAGNARIVGTGCFPAEPPGFLQNWLNSRFFLKKSSPGTSISLDHQVIIMTGKKRNIFPPPEKIRWLPLLPPGLLFSCTPCLFLSEILSAELHSPLKHGASLPRFCQTESLAPGRNPWVYLENSWPRIWSSTAYAIRR